MELPAGTSSLDPGWIETAETLPITVWTARPDGSIEFVNRRWHEMTGVSAQIILTEGWASVVHPDDLPRTASAYQESLETGKPLRVDLRIHASDGSYRWVRNNADPLRDETGEITRWFGVVLDIDETHRADERTRTLAEAVPVIVWTAAPDGWIEWYNHRWYEYTGQTVEQAAGWGWQTAHHPEDFLEVMRQWPHSIATGKPFEMEFRLRRYDGIFHWFLTRVEPQRDASGKVIRWYGSNVDIDEQKQALERTKRVAETLQDVFLPKQLPQKAHLRLDAVYLAAEKDALIGGDWFDAFELPDGSLAFSIGDVAGHGLQASEIVGRLRQTIFTLALRMSDPAEILCELDGVLRCQDPGVMVTAIAGFIDSGCKELRYANAGHPPPLIAYKNDKLARVLPSGGLPLGTGFDLKLLTQRVPIEADAVVALYTDGLIEFGRDAIEAERKLQAAVALLVGNKNIARPALAVQELVFNDMPARDDAALLLMQFSRVVSPLKDDPRMLERTWRFHSSDAYTAHTSRHEITKHLRALASDPEEVFAGELILGEIFANTVEHAPGLVEVDLDWTGALPVVTVRDTGPGLRELNGALPEDIMDEGGRGIFLIRALSEDASGKTSPGYGTELRVTLPIRRKSAAQPDLPADSSAFDSTP